MLDEFTRRFADTDFVLNRARSDVPFIPMAWLYASRYGESEFASKGGAPSGVDFRESTVSEGTIVPIPFGRRDALLIGQWASLTELDLSPPQLEDIDVVSVAVPVGWMRQSSPNWQEAAFVAPLGHHSSRSGWSWEYMGGVFARYTRDDRLSWIYGLFADLSPGENLWIPYIGASLVLNQHWTLSAVLPWPAVLYSPTPDSLFRFGVSPSGTSWSVDADITHPRIDFGAWNLGVSAERRSWKNLWLHVEAGVSGLRGFSFEGSDWEGPNADLKTTPYVSIGITFRPDEQ